VRGGGVNLGYGEYDIRYAWRATAILVTLTLVVMYTERYASSIVANNSKGHEYINRRCILDIINIHPDGHPILRNNG